MKRLILLSLLALTLTGCVPTPPDVTSTVGDIQTKTVVIEGRTYLAQWQSNGHWSRWVIVAGPITTP